MYIYIYREREREKPKLFKTYFHYVGQVGLLVKERLSASLCTFCLNLIDYTNPYGYVSDMFELHRLHIYRRIQLKCDRYYEKSKTTKYFVLARSNILGKSQIP
jgi:hypothetical protein